MQDHHDQREDLYTTNRGLTGPAEFYFQTLAPMKRYELDMDKITTLDDVKRVLIALKIAIYGEEATKGIEDLVKEAA